MGVGVESEFVGECHWWGFVFPEDLFLAFLAKKSNGFGVGSKPNEDLNQSSLLCEPISLSYSR